MVVAVAAAASVRDAPGTAAPDVTVVIVCAAPNPLSPLNVKPPTPPFDILVSVTDGSLALVNVQAMADPAAVAALSRTSAPVARSGVADPPAPIPVQVAEVRAKPAGMASVIVVAVDAAVSVLSAP